MGYKTYQNVLQLWEGSYLSRTAQSFYDWGVIAQHFEAMRLLGELQNTMKPLPSIDGQLSLMTAGAEERKPSAFTFSQEIIDAVLTRGSGISEGKMRIYEQFQKSLSAKENADFLKNEYGWGGVYPAIVGADIDEQHDGKGIRISKGIGSDKPHIDLKWSQVEKRIGELIKLDRYLNPKEKAQYPEWLQRQEERQAELAEERRNREIFSTAPSEKAEPKNERYEYHLGSTVYLGANEYEILSFDDERVMLYDTQFPLFNKEMTRAEFDSKVQENPLNDHLKVAIKQPEEKAVEYDIGMGYLGNGLTVWNRAVEVNGDYQNIAHISPEGEITFYVQDLPQRVVERIRQTAEREKPKDAALPEFYQAYLKTKADNPGSLLLYQVGDFFEAYADDAEVVGTALDLVQTTRAVDHNTRVPMVGFPQHRLETYLTMLTDRGYDVEVNSLEDGERSTRTVVSTTKEAPVESKPIGRIDYLGTDGKVGESIEYTSPYQFEKDIKEENYYGVPMSIVLYKDKDGSTIPYDFVTRLDPPPKGFEIIDSPYLTERFAVIETENGYAVWDETRSAIYVDEEGVSEEFASEWQANDYLKQLQGIPPIERTEASLDTAKHLIDDFCREEYQREDGADYTDLTNVGIAYTTTEDDKHEIQARVNLVDFRIETLADGKVVRSVQYASLEELTEKGLQALSFDDLVYLSEEELAQVEAPLTPVWEHPKKSRVQTFDIHPEIPIAKLCDIGIDIEEERSRENRYSLSSHLFTLPELKLLIDAVESSKFITVKKSAELIEKLSQMTSIHQAAELKSNLYVSERVKPLNEQIYYLVDNINTAINRGKQISFRYFHYDQHRKEVPNNDGKRYFFSPYCLVWNEDHYYAIGYSEKHRKLGTFRVDRMKEVEILSADAAAKPADFNLPEFTRRVFDMYDGETKKVTLVCKNDLMNYIVDRFGDEVDTVPGDCGHFRAVAEVSVSQTFFAWVFQFNGDIRITAPEEVVLQYGEMLKNALQT